MKIDQIIPPRSAILAPMAGFTDRSYREICKRFKVPFMVTEMASAKALCYQDRKTVALLEIPEEQRPTAIQLFGGESDVMAKAAGIICERFAPDVIDINMGCPAPKITSNNSGCALMKDIRLAEEIVSAVVANSNVPVSVKFRKGYDDSCVNAVEFAKMCEHSGASFITIHGRTRSQMYKPPVDLDIIAKVTQSVGIPVIGNGDILTPADAKHMFESTGCYAVAIARGSLGNPWIFQSIRSYLETGSIPPAPSLAERLETMLLHTRLICEHKGEYIGMREARKHAAHYLKGLKGAAKFRNIIFSLSEYRHIAELAENIADENSIL